MPLEAPTSQTVLPCQLLRRGLSEEEKNIIRYIIYSYLRLRIKHQRLISYKFKQTVG
jgi:hypothetical protein